jgi:hypothetical protein
MVAIASAVPRNTRDYLSITLLGIFTLSLPDDLIMHVTPLSGLLDACLDYAADEHWFVASLGLRRVHNSQP